MSTPQAVPDWMQGLRREHAESAAAGWASMAAGFRQVLETMPFGHPDRAKCESQAVVAEQMAAWWESVDGFQA